MAKRVALFFITNLLIIATISITMSVLGVQPYLSQRGINYQALVIFCLIWGMGGAFISLGLSRIMAKWMMRVKVIDPDQPGEFNELVNMIKEITRSAGLKALPQIGVYEAPDPNAFATGPTQKRALVAVSTGLLRQMNREEVKGVLAHEVAHIKNGDMVTMTLLQGIINAMVLFISRIIAFFVTQWVREEMRFVAHIVTTIVLDILLSILGSLVVRAFSRKREFHADAGAAKLVGKAPMVAALRSLQRNMPQTHEQDEPAAVAAFKISNKTKQGFAKYFMTHPPLEDRISALETATF